MLDRVVEVMIGKRCLVPVLRPFPIWRYSPYGDESWYPDRYASVEVEVPKS